MEILAGFLILFNDGKCLFKSSSSILFAAVDNLYNHQKVVELWKKLQK